MRYAPSFLMVMETSEYIASQSCHWAQALIRHTLKLGIYRHTCTMQFY